MMDYPDKLTGRTALAIEGGGTLGLSAVGINGPLHLLDTAVGLRNLTAIAGASVGALLSLPIALGATFDQVRDIATRTPVRKFPDRSWALADIVRLFRTGGWHKLTAARATIDSIIAQLGHDIDITFAQLVDRRGVSFLVAATSEQGLGLRMFGPGDDIPIRQAVLASMAIPLYWPPVDIDGTNWCDGGVLANHPVEPLAKLGYLPHQLFGIRFDRAREINPRTLARTRNPVRRIVRLLNTLREANNRSYVPDEFWPSIVRIDTTGYSATDFNIGEIGRLELESRGAQAMVKWLEKR